MNINNNEVEKLVEEISDMCETVEGIQGRKYQTALLAFTNVINMVNTTNAAMQALLEVDVIDKDSCIALDKIQDTVLNDLLARLASMLALPLEGATDKEERAEEDRIFDSLKKDAKMILRKQKEYSVNSNGKKEG